MRWRELIGYGLLMAACLAVACIGVARAAGLEASFASSQDPCGSDPSLVFCYDGTVDEAGNLVDKIGGNLLTDRNEFDDWTGTAVVTADQWRSPVSGELTADYLNNVVPGSGGSRYQVTADLGALNGRSFTFSVWARADYVHDITVLYYELPGGTIKTQNHTVGKTWKRVSVSGTEAGGGNNTILAAAFPGVNGVSAGQAYFSDAQLYENDQWRTNFGTYLNPVDQSVTKPALNAAPTNTPTRALSDVEHQGNRLKARRLNGTNQYYTTASHACLDVNDTDHTYTFYVRSNYSAGTDTLYLHGGWQSDGVYIQTNGAGYWAAYNKSGGITFVYSAGVTPSDGEYHIYQLVRKDDVGVFYSDGVAGAPVDLSTYGVDSTKIAYLGSYNASDYFEGDIAFAKLEAKARTEDELASDREKIWATYGGKGSASASWDVARSTVAMKTFTAGGAHAINSAMTEVAANVPRVARGLLVEAQATQLHGLTYALQSWNVSPPGGVVLTANDYPAPDGTTTACELDNTAGASTNSIYVNTADLGSLAGRTFTLSAYVRSETPRNVSIMLWENGVGQKCTSTIYATPEYRRIHCTATMAGGGANTLQPNLYPGELSVAVGVSHWWGANLTETSFPVSYIANGGAEASQVTRTADDVTMFPVRFTGLPLDGSETMWIDFSQDPIGATITTSDGGYTLTKVGQPEHHRTEVFGDYHYFDGTDRWTSTIGPPAGDFSAQCVVAPSSIAASNRIVIGNTDYGGGTGIRGWDLQSYDTRVLFNVSDDGTGGGGHFTQLVSGTGCVEADRPSLITVTFDFIADGSSVMTIYCNGLATATTAVADGPVFASAPNLSIGWDFGGTALYSYSGGLLYCDFSNGVVLTEAQHDAAYAQFVQDYVLPKSFGGAGEPDKLTISFDAKCEWSSSADIGATRPILSIGGNTGTASNVRNRFWIYGYTNGILYSELNDDASTLHYMATAVNTVDYSEWFNFRTVWDLSDLTRSEVYINGVVDSPTEVAKTGAVEFDLTDTKIGIGQFYDGTVTGNCFIENLRITAQEIRP